MFQVVYLHSACAHTITFFLAENHITHVVNSTVAAPHFLKEGFATFLQACLSFNLADDVLDGALAVGLDTLPCATTAENSLSLAA